MVSADWPESFEGAVNFVPEVIADERDINQWQRCDLGQKPAALSPLRSGRKQCGSIASRPTPSHRDGASTPVNPCQLAGLRAVTIHAAPSIITDRAPGRFAKAARTAVKARARMSSG